MINKMTFRAIMLFVNPGMIYNNDLSTLKDNSHRNICLICVVREKTVSPSSNQVKARATFLKRGYLYRLLYSYLTASHKTRKRAKLCLIMFDRMVDVGEQLTPQNNSLLISGCIFCVYLIYKVQTILSSKPDSQMRCLQMYLNTTSGEVAPISTVTAG